VGVLVSWLLYAVVVPWCFLPAPSRWCGAGACQVPSKVGILPVVMPGLVGADAAEHLVPSCSIHHDVLPCRGWDLAEEEVGFSRRSLFVVVSSVVVAAVAVVDVAVTAVLWGGGAWFACGDDVLVAVWRTRVREVEPGPAGGWSRCSTALATP
jgi:hypothetical protein